MIFKETRIQSLSFAVRDSRSPHMCRAPLRFPHLSFIPLVPYPPLFSAPLSPSFLWKEGERGAEVGRVKRCSHIRGNQPRLASLVCPFQRKGRE